MAPCFEDQEASLSNYLQPSISSSVKCGHMAVNWSAGCTTNFVNIGKNVIVASKSGPVETVPTVLVAMALHIISNYTWPGVVDMCVFVTM